MKDYADEDSVDDTPDMGRIYVAIQDGHSDGPEQREELCNPYVCFAVHKVNDETLQ
jgi:hypothetical protein